MLVVLEFESFPSRASTSEDSEIRQLAWLPDKSHMIQHAPLEKASRVGRTTSSGGGWAKCVTPLHPSR